MSEKRVLVEPTAPVYASAEQAAALRAQAAAHAKEAADSFARCDTDGFLSQWASGLNAQLKRKEAEIAEAGGLWTFERHVLVTSEGEATDARQVETRYGPRWRLDSRDLWLPFRPARESTLGKRGFREVVESEVGPAKAIHWGTGRGLSGATSVRTIVIRTDKPKSECWYPVGPPEEAS